MTERANVLLQVLDEHPDVGYCGPCLAKAAGVVTITGFDEVEQFMQEARAGLWGGLKVEKAGRCSVCRQAQPTIAKPRAGVVRAQ
jgi:hypothetical protein